MANPADPAGSYVLCSYGPVEFERADWQGLEVGQARL